MKERNVTSSIKLAIQEKIDALVEENNKSIKLIGNFVNGLFKEIKESEEFVA